MSIPNPLAGVVAFLVGTPEVYNATGGRVFGSELPKNQAGAMPQAAVVVRAAGGGGPASDVPYLALTVDATCYGATPYAALELYLVVKAALRDLRRDTMASALLHSAVEVAGPLDLRDPDTHWPFCWSSWRVLAGEKEST